MIDFMKYHQTTHCIFPNTSFQVLETKLFLTLYTAMFLSLISKLVIIHFLDCDPGFPGGSEVKSSACNAGDLGSIPGSGRSPGEGNGNLLQYSCLENAMDGGAWWATCHGVTKSQTWLSDFTHLTVITSEKISLTSLSEQISFYYFLS